MYSADFSHPAQCLAAARLTLARLEPRLAAEFAGDAAGWAAFQARLVQRFPELFELLLRLYGGSFDLAWHIEQLLLAAARAAAARPQDLRERDRVQEASPDWFLDHRQIGAVAYVDRFAGTLAGVAERLDSLEALGVTYLHLMPLFARPPGENDGGYAVSSYRDVHPPLGSMDDLAGLARTMHRRGMALCVDFILNHTAHDHPWAEAARRGDGPERDLYFMFEDRELPDAYAAMLRAIFPERGGDAFVWREDVVGPQGGMHVWATFYPFQWDLNYANPATLTAIAGEMLFLANQGVDILRLDAVPFLWKRLGTTCENLPEAHLVVRALNAVTDIAAPALVFKSEAIVHPDDVASYVDPAECHLSYNPLLMVCVWEAMATRDNRLLRDCLETRHRTSAGTAWVNYVRCHDDIGWGFANEDCERLGIDPVGHRLFLNQFYTGRFAGSFARGLPFQENPRTGDCRISGTLASLAGLEEAIEAGDTLLIDHAIRRILVMHALIMTVGGIPLLYLGDEIAQLNDYGFLDDPATARDNRWVHRPRYDWLRRAEAERGGDTAHARVLAGLKRLIALRTSEPALSGSELLPAHLDGASLIAFHRLHRERRLTLLVNFTEHTVALDGATLTRLLGPVRHLDRWQETVTDPGQGLEVGAYGLHWLVQDGTIQSAA